MFVHRYELRPYLEECACMHVETCHGASAGQAAILSTVITPGRTNNVIIKASVKLTL
jgi:hypothetical protein